MLFKDDRICIVNANNKYFSFYQQKQMIKGVPCDISILKFEDINKIYYFMIDWEEKNIHRKFGIPEDFNHSLQIFNFFIQMRPADVLIPIDSDTSIYQDEVRYSFSGNKLTIQSDIFKRYKEFTIVKK